MDAELKNVLEAMRQENALAHTENRRAHEETRRLVGVMVDGLRDELQIVAEGVATNTIKIERLDEKVERLFSELDVRVTHLEARQRG